MKIKVTALFIWMACLHWFAAEASENIRDLPLYHYLPAPTIDLEPSYIDLSHLSSQLRGDAEFTRISAIFDKFREGDSRGAYVAADNYIRANPTTPFEEWLYFFKADVLFKTHATEASPQLSLALEDYELASRLYPRSEFMPRALYHMGLIKLESGLFQEVEQLAERGLTDFPTSSFVPRFSILSGEQAFRGGNYEKALREFSLVLRRYPRNPAAVDAAFRRGYILYRDKQYKEALQTYEELDKYHADAFRFLRMEQDPSSPQRFYDRIFYAETLALTKNYTKASDVFQAIGNRFPHHDFTPLVWIRFGDTYLNRGQLLAARSIYNMVYNSERSDVIARAMSRIQLTRLYRQMDTMLEQRHSRELLEQAFDLAMGANDTDLAALSLTLLVDYLLRFYNYPRAKAVLEQLREELPGNHNHQWQDKKYIEVLEAEILDYYQSEDFLAALTTYLVNEVELASEFNNVNVLLKLADAAVDLGLFEKATDILNRVIYVESSDLARQEALLKLIGVLIRQGDHRRASERLRRFNFAYPKTSFRHLYEKQWGDLYFALDNHNRAIEHYERSLKAAEGKKEALHSIRMNHIRLGGLYQKVALPVKAALSYQNFIDIFADKENVILSGLPFTDQDRHWVRVSHYRIADLYFETRDYVQALSSYQRVLLHVTEEPFVSHAQYRIGECYLALNDRPSAIDAFSKVKSDDPNNLWVRAAQSYIQSVKIEVENELRIFN